MIQLLRELIDLPCSNIPQSLTTQQKKLNVTEIEPRVPRGDYCHPRHLLCDWARKTLQLSHRFGEATTTCNLRVNQCNNQLSSTVIYTFKSTRLTEALSRNLQFTRGCTVRLFDRFGKHTKPPLLFAYFRLTQYVISDQLPCAERGITVLVSSDTVIKHKIL